MFGQLNSLLLLLFLKLAVNETLKKTLDSVGVVLNGDIARGFIQEGVGLDIDLAGLLLLQNHIADLGAPVLEANMGHLVVELGSLFDITSRLVDVGLLKEVGNSCVKRKLAHIRLNIRALNHGTTYPWHQS